MVVSYWLLAIGYWLLALGISYQQTVSPMLG
jgi:hypothetical protein